MKSKRFLLFAWPLYRSMGGGWEDYIGDYDTREQAVKDFDQDYNKGGDECYSIVDTTTMKLVQAGTYGVAARKPIYPIDDTDKCGMPTKPKDESL